MEALPAGRRVGKHLTVHDPQVIRVCVCVCVCVCGGDVTLCLAFDFGCIHCPSFLQCDVHPDRTSVRL